MAKAVSAKLPFNEGYSYSRARELVELSLRAGIAVLLRGHPGVGKSAMAQDLAQSLGLELVDIRLAQRDPAELAGVAFPDHQRGVLRQFPPEWVERACNGPVLVFLDEINAAVTRLHQAAAYQIVLERRVGPFRFHPETRVMAAGNLEEDNAIVTSLSSALCNRFAHVVLAVDHRDWLSWASGAGIHEAITGYIAQQGDKALFNNDGEMAFPTPRSWEMASRLLYLAEERIARQAVASCVGVSSSEQLFNFIRLCRRVNPERIIKKGELPDFRSGKASEPSFLSAALFSVAAWVAVAPELETEAYQNMVKFISSPGVDPEYAFLFLRRIRQRPDHFMHLKALPDFRRVAGNLVAIRTQLYR